MILDLVIMPNMKMNNRKRTRCETRANILKALAHPMRLFMLEELANKSYCVSELTEMVGLDVSTVSKDNNDFPFNTLLSGSNLSLIEFPSYSLFNCPFS